MTDEGIGGTRRHTDCTRRYKQVLAGTSRYKQVQAGTRGGGGGGGGWPWGVVVASRAIVLFPWHYF